MIFQFFNSFSKFSILLVPSLLLFLFLWECIKAKRLPEMELVVELLALGAALHLSSTMLWSAIEFCGTDPNKALGPFFGFVVIALSSVIGVSKIFKSVRPQYKPLYDSKPKTSSKEFRKKFDSVK